jgi:hypothetical protein
MALTTLADVMAGLRPPAYFTKAGLVNSANYASGWSTYWDRTGFPLLGAYSPNANYTDPLVTGAVPFLNPTSGDAYLAKMTLMGGTSGCGGILLCDRLWASASLSATILTSQSITSGPFPARDENGSTDGVGVFLAVEIITTTTGGSGDLSFTATYTNSSGTGSRTAQSVFAPTPRNQSGCYILGLDNGDVGVRSVQAFQLTGTTAHTAGAVNLVAFRPIAAYPIQNGTTNVFDPITGGLPEVYPDSVLYFMGETGESGTGYAGNPTGRLQFAWG